MEDSEIDRIGRCEAYEQEGKRSVWTRCPCSGLAVMRRDGPDGEWNLYVLCKKHRQADKITVV